MFLLKKCVVMIVVLVVVVVVVGVGGGYYWVIWLLLLGLVLFDVMIKLCSSVKSVVLQFKCGGVLVELFVFVVMMCVFGLLGWFKLGNYEFKIGIMLYDVLQKIVCGDVNEYVVMVIEGWIFKWMCVEFDVNFDLVYVMVGMSDVELLCVIGVLDGVVQCGSGEGLFFFDIYLFDKGMSDLNIYWCVYCLMQMCIDEVWVVCMLGLLYKMFYEMLMIVLIVEKEIGYVVDCVFVVVVFVNWLCIGMLLQIDLFVIYGFGDVYDGWLCKCDLQVDIFYNIYI